MTPSTCLRVVTDAVIIPSVIDLVVAAARFVAVLFTVFTHVAEEAYVIFPTAAMAVGHADEVRKHVLEDGVVVNFLMLCVIIVWFLVVRGSHDVGNNVVQGRHGSGFAGVVRHLVGRRTEF